MTPDDIVRIISSKTGLSEETISALPELAVGLIWHDVSARKEVSKGPRCCKDRIPVRMATKPGWTRCYSCGCETPPKVEASKVPKVPSKELAEHVERVATAATNLGLVACSLEEVNSNEGSRFALIEREAWKRFQDEVELYKKEVEVMLKVVDAEGSKL